MLSQPWARASHSIETAELRPGGGLSSHFERHFSSPAFHHRAEAYRNAVQVLISSTCAEAYRNAVQVLISSTSKKIPIDPEVESITESKGYFRVRTRVALCHHTLACGWRALRRAVLMA